MIAPVARLSDPLTSHTAGLDALRRSTAKEDVLHILREYGPLHDEAIREIHEGLVEAGRMAAKSPQRLRTARSELYDAGQVRELTVGTRVQTVVLRSGYHSIRWEVADA